MTRITSSRYFYFSPADVESRNLLVRVLFAWAENRTEADRQRAAEHDLHPTGAALFDGATELDRIIIIGHRSDCQQCWAAITGLLAHVQDAYAMIGDDTQWEYIEAIKRHMEWMSDGRS